MAASRLLALGTPSRILLQSLPLVVGSSFYAAQSSLFIGRSGWDNTVRGLHQWLTALNLLLIGWGSTDTALYFLLVVDTALCSLVIRCGSLLQLVQLKNAPPLVDRGAGGGSLVDQVTFGPRYQVHWINAHPAGGADPGRAPNKQ